MNLRIEVEDTSTPALRKLTTRTLPLARKQMIVNAGQRLLELIVEDHPVRSGRARAAWSAALAQLGGRPTYPGNDPDAISQGRSRGSAAISDDADRSLASATNAVNYVPFLEYGARRMAPFAMAREAMVALIGTIGSLFTLDAPGNADQRRG
jgi:hypothetical protein